MPEYGFTNGFLWLAGGHSLSVAKRFHRVARLMGNSKSMIIAEDLFDNSTDSSLKEDELIYLPVTRAGQVLRQIEFMIGAANGRGKLHPAMIPMARELVDRQEQPFGQPSKSYVLRKAATHSRRFQDAYLKALVKIAAPAMRVVFVNILSGSTSHSIMRAQMEDCFEMRTEVNDYLRTTGVGTQFTTDLVGVIPADPLEEGQESNLHQLRFNLEFIHDIKNAFENVAQRSGWRYDESTPPFGLDGIWLVNQAYVAGETLAQRDVMTAVHVVRTLTQQPVKLTSDQLEYAAKA